MGSSGLYLEVKEHPNTKSDLIMKFRTIKLKIQ